MQPDPVFEEMVERAHSRLWWKTRIDLADALRYAGVPEVLERERRYEAALREIRDHGTANGHECWALHQGDCADRFQEIARVALPSPENSSNDGGARRWTLAEAQEVHAALGVAIETGDTSLLRRARELVAVLVADLGDD